MRKASYWLCRVAAAPADFPHTTRLAPLLYPSLDEQFEFGIDVLIGGLRQRVSRGG